MALTEFNPIRHFYMKAFDIINEVTIKLFVVQSGLKDDLKDYTEK